MTQQTKKAHKRKSNNIITVIKKGITDAAEQYDVAPYDVTPAQFWSVVGDKVPEWQIRKLGGFTGQRDALFPAPTTSQTTVLPRSIGAHSKSSGKLKLLTPKLDNFTVHETPMREIFKLAKLKDDEVLRIVVEPDTHTPDHDEDAIQSVCEFLHWYKPHGLINLGDFMEMEPVSPWPSVDGKPRVFVDDVKSAKKLLARIDKAAGPQCVYKRFIIGNHEDWLNQLLTAKVPEFMYKLEDIGCNLKIQDLLGLKDLGYRVIPLNEILRLGNAHFIHGYYTGTHHAKKHLDIFGVNIYYGHLHDIQGYSGVSVKGTHESMSLGCLRTLQAKFLKGKPNNWSHALGIFEFTIDGNYTRYVPIIIDGTFTFNGKRFGKKK
jgi:hypothetical protein